MPITIAELFQRAEHNRVVVSDRLLKTPEAIRGINELLIYLENTRSSIASEPTLHRMDFFINRAIHDVEVAIVSAYMGMISVTVDACRDMMEIELLLKDFSLSPERIEEWFEATERDRMNRFRPNQLRQRQARKLGVAPKDLPDSEDYALHSAAVHVSPDKILWRRGVVPDPRPWFESDFAIAELLDHSDRFVNAFLELVKLIAPGVVQAPSDVGYFSIAVELVRTRFVPRFHEIVDAL